MPKTNGDNEDHPQKGYDEILGHEIESGLKEFRRPVVGLLLSALSGGMDIGFSVVVMGTVLTLAEGNVPEPWLTLLLANSYAVGFLLVILGRSELFTEHTTLAVLPVLDKQASVPELFRVWACVLGGNLVGVGLFAMLLAWIGPSLGFADEKALVHLADKMLDHSPLVMFVSAVLAGWLMGELAWLLAAGRDTTSQILFVVVVTGTIGLAGLHHSIVGTVEAVVGAILSDTIGLVDVLSFMAIAVVGNALGGTVFVAVLKYGHATRGQG